MSPEHDGPEPYDLSQPFDADELLDGFTCAHAVRCLSVEDCGWRGSANRMLGTDPAR